MVRNFRLGIGFFQANANYAPVPRVSRLGKPLKIQRIKTKNIRYIKKKPLYRMVRGGLGR